MLTLVRIALRNLLAAKRRSGLLGAAVTLVTLLLVVLLSLSRGVEDNLVEAATTVSSGHVNVAGFFKPTGSSSAPVITGKDDIRAVVERAVSGIDYIVERDRGWGKVVSETGSVQIGLNGIVAEDEARFFDNLRPALESEYVEGGRDQVIGDARQLARAGTIVLFASQARSLGVRVGDEVTISTETDAGLSNTTDVTVVAVAQDLGFLSSFAAFLPRETVLELYQLNPQTTGALWLYLDDISQADQVMGDLRIALADAGYRLMDHDPNPFFFKFDRVKGEDWSGQKLDLTVWKDEVSYVAWILTAFDSLSVMLVFVLIVIIAVGIMNAMWTAVRERTNEIGTLRAIGMQRTSVLLLFMLEALLLGIFASGLGALGGLAIALAVDAAQVKVGIDAVQAILLSDTVAMRATPQALIASAAFVTFFTALSALWPSLRAAAMRPVDALRQAE